MEINCNLDLDVYKACLKVSTQNIHSFQLYLGCLVVYSSQAQEAGISHLRNRFLPFLLSLRTLHYLLW